MTFLKRPIYYEKISILNPPASSPGEMFTVDDRTSSEKLYDVFDSNSFGRPRMMSSVDASREPWQIQPPPPTSPIPCGAELTQGTKRIVIRSNDSFFI